VRSMSRLTSTLNSLQVLFNTSSFLLATYLHGIHVHVALQ